MRRSSTILFLALLVISLHLAARNLYQLMDFARNAGVLTNANPKAKAAARLDFTDISRRLPNLPQTKPLSAPIQKSPLKKFFTTHKTKRVPSSKKRQEETTLPRWLSASPWILQIVDEENRPLPANPFLSDMEKELLANILLQQRQDNDRTVRDIATMVHIRAGQEALAILVQQESLLETAAEKASSLEDFFQRREQILTDTQHRLNATFNRRMQRQALTYKQK